MNELEERLVEDLIDPRNIKGRVELLYIPTRTHAVIYVSTQELINRKHGKSISRIREDLYGYRDESGKVLTETITWLPMPDTPHSRRVKRPTELLASVEDFFLVDNKGEIQTLTFDLVRGINFLGWINPHDIAVCLIPRYTLNFPKGTKVESKDGVRSVVLPDGSMIPNPLLHDEVDPKTAMVVPTNVKESKYNDKTVFLHTEDTLGLEPYIAASEVRYE